MQPAHKNRKHTFVLDDSESDEVYDLEKTAAQQSAYHDDGSVGNVSETDSDIGLTTNDTIRLPLAAKGGMQPIKRNQKRTFLVDDSDGEDYYPPSCTSLQQNAYVDDGSVGDVSESDSDDSDNTSLTNPVTAKPPDSNWQPRCIKRRPIMSKLTTHVYLSNDTIRVATLNLNGALYRTDYDHTPLCDYILRNHIDIMMLIDHRASDSKMNNHIRRIRERCAKDIEYVSVGPDLKGPTSSTKSNRNKEVGGCAIIAIGKVSSTFQKSVIRDPTGAGTFCGGWLHLPNGLPDIHLTAVYIFPESKGEGYTVHDRLELLLKAKNIKQKPRHWMCQQLRTQLLNLLDPGAESIIGGDFNLQRWDSATPTIDYRIKECILNLGHTNIPWAQATERDPTGKSHPQTFNADKSAARWIDHILTRGQLFVTKYHADLANLSDHEPFHVTIRLPREFKNHLPHAQYYARAQRANCNYNIPPNPANKDLLGYFALQLKHRSAQLKIDEVGQVAYLQSLPPPEVNELFTNINLAIADAARRAHQAVRPSCGTLSIKPHLWSPDTKLLYEYSKWLKITRRRISKCKSDAILQFIPQAARAFIKRFTFPPKQGETVNKYTALLPL